MHSFNNHEIVMKSLVSLSLILVKKDERVFFLIEMSFLIWKSVFKTKTCKKKKKKTSQLNHFVNVERRPGDPELRRTVIFRMQLSW